MKTESKLGWSGIGLLIYFCGSIALAGGVSDGGGGTTNPHPVNPEDIVQAASYGEGSKIILSWLYRREAEFHEMKPSDQIKSPYRKLFDKQKDVFGILKGVKFELRMKAPCLDANGAPKDGSIYGSQPGALCLSPFSMAPKLTEITAARETVALMIHEISHLLGTSEDEAVAIQWDALRDFNRIDFMTAFFDIQQLAGGRTSDIALALSDVDLWIRYPNQARESYLARWLGRLTQIYQRIETPTETLLYASESVMKPYLPEFVKVEVIKAFVCTQDPSLSAGVKQDCSDTLKKVFQSDESLTARQITIRRDGYDPGPNGDLVKIRRPRQLKDISTALQEVSDYLKSVSSQILALQTFEIASYRTN